VKILDTRFESLDLIDTLSERHLQLRRVTEKLWNDRSEIYLSNSEWFIIARIYKKETTIAYVTKHVDFTRQATHKVIKSLVAKGLVETFNVEHNKKDKYIRLTSLGEECYEKNESLKAEIEQKIAQEIGDESLIALKAILKKNWGL
jgi:DNA-binding MarR family transcriptional regulator